MLGQHSEKAGDTAIAVEWYLQYDLVLSLLGEVDQRGTVLARTLALAIKHGEASKVAEVHYHQGAFHENLGDHQGALESFKHALVGAREAGDQRLVGLVLAFMVVNTTRLGDQESAATLALEALSLLDQIEEDESRARILTNVAFYYNESGDIGKAAELYQRQIELTRHMGNKFGEAVGLGNLGFVYLKLGLFEEGREALEQASQIT